MRCIGADTLDVATRNTRFWIDDGDRGVTSERGLISERIVIPGQLDRSFTLSDRGGLGNYRHEIPSFVEFCKEIKPCLRIVQRAAAREGRGVYGLDGLVGGSRIPRQSDLALVIWLQQIRPIGRHIIYNP